MPKRSALTEEQWAVLAANAREKALLKAAEKRAATDQPLGYYGAHRRVRKARGRAGDQLCIECSRPARDWAHVHDTNPDDPANYRPMCKRCHSAYDRIGEKIVAAKGPEGLRNAAIKAWGTKHAARDRPDNGAH